jgi:hypothetical protein
MTEKEAEEGANALARSLKTAEPSASGIDLSQRVKSKISAKTRVDESLTASLAGIVCDIVTGLAVA